MEGFENRYEVKTPWKKIRSGSLARAADLKLNRHVLLCKMPESNKVRTREALNRLGKNAWLTDKRFIQLLDGYAGQDELFAVLSDDGGELLTEAMGKLDWSGRELLTKVRELTAGVREARKERLPLYALSADNIWLDREGSLRIIDYWTEAGVEDRDVRGLARLVYQLSSRTAEDAPSMTDYCDALRSRLTDLPGGGEDEAVLWAASAFHPSCTLKEFEAGLDRLLTAPEADPAAAVTGEEPKQPWYARYRIKRWLWICGSIIVCWAVFVWFLTSPLLIGGDKEEGRELSKAPKVTASADPSTDAPAASEKAAPSKAPSRAPSATPKETDRPDSQAGTGESKTVPNLVGRSRAEAEKLALQAGLKYQFKLDSDASEQGTVFKQDLKPGDPVQSGSTITFWVSKGQ